MMTAPKEPNQLQRLESDLAAWFSTEGGTSWSTDFERTVSAAQAVDNPAHHSHQLLELILFVKSDGNTLLQSEDVDQNQNRETRSIAARNMDTVTRRVVEPQRARIPLGKLAEQQFVSDALSDLMLQDQ